MPGNSRAQINSLCFNALKDSRNFEKYFGQDNRMLNGYLTDNIDLKKSLNYQVPNVSGQQILDVIPSQNSEFTLISKPNGVVQLHSTALNLSDIKQIIMFSNDGDKINAMHNYNMKKLKSKEQECIKCNKSILAKSSEIKYLVNNMQSLTGEKTKKKSSKQAKDASAPSQTS
jgi:hypothetical protein